MIQIGLWFINNFQRKFNRFADENQYVSKLESIGYVLKIREPDWYQHRCFKHFDPEVNLHVFSKDCKESKRMIWFRNHLRNNF